MDRFYVGDRVRSTFGEPPGVGTIVLIDAVSVRCIKCGSWTRLANVYADLDGEAFKAYYCVDTCVPKEKDEDSLSV